MISFETTEPIPDATDVRLYIHRWDVHAKQTNVGYIREFKEITDDLIAEHLFGQVSIGTYQIRLDNTVTWICIDVDAHSEDKIAESNRKCFEIFCRLCEHCIPFVVEASGSPHSYHFWIFLDRTDASKVYWFIRELLDGIDVEKNPKQPEIDKEKPFGNLVKLPYGINNKTGNRSTLVWQTKPLSRINLENYSPSEYKLLLDERQRELIKTTDDILPSDVRPCLAACAMGEIQMTGTGGHTLRIALVSELRLGAGMPFDSIVSVFKHQPDFDISKTEYQVKSVWGYNRFTCRKLQTDAGNMIIEYCKECKYNAR